MWASFKLDLYLNKDTWRVIIQIFKTQALGILLMPIFLHFFLGGGGGVGGEAPSPSDRPYMGCLVTSKKFPSLDSNG